MVSTTNGDTLIVLVAVKQITMGPTGIDAPKRRQPFGTRSPEFLAESCADKEARPTVSRRVTAVESGHSIELVAQRRAAEVCC
jgi:endonuclease YncB( thermonuclease family)